MQYALLLYTSQDVSPESRRQTAEAVAPVLERPNVRTWARLHGTQTATTVRLAEGETLLTDGPFVDSKDYLGGLVIIDAANLDEALTVAAELQALRSTPGGAIEVRPMLEEPLRGS